MDPNNVKLTAKQKIVPLLKAIDKEIPWQLILLTLIAVIVSVYTASTIGIPVIDKAPYFVNVVLLLVFSGIAGIATFFIVGITIFTIAEKIMPLIDRIKVHYNDEALKVKKEVLDNAEEDMLK